MRVGLLRLETPPPAAGPGPLAKVFIDTMRELGWVEGRNIVYDFAYADGDAARLPETAAALVARRPDVIYTTNNQITQAAFRATRTIPIVFSTVSEPVEAGLVKSLARPGGNVTGISPFRGELGARRMQLLKEVLPNIVRVGVLVAPGGPGASQEQRQIEQAAGSGVKIFSAAVKAAQELQGALATLVAHKPEAVLLRSDAMFLAQRKVILEFAAKHRIPVVGHFGPLADDGALLSYNSSLPDHHRRTAHLVDKVLRGANPADLPVEQPTQFELVINLKTAKALGIMVPQSVLLQATRVIE
jgi:putative ABC transport system substrate-binding protein